MTNHLLVRWGVIGALLWTGPAVGGAAGKEPETGVVGSGTATAPAPAPLESAAASQPASEIVLAKVGDKASGAITQAEFNAYFFDGPPVSFERKKDQFGRELVERKWLLFYIEDHPELNVEATVREQTEMLMKEQNLKTDQELDAWLRTKRMTLEVWLRYWRIKVVKTRLSLKGDKLAADEELLKKTFDAAPSEFNGTRLAARHILIGTSVFDTPAEKRAKREKAEKIREDLVSGKRTWEDALKESTDSDTKLINGSLGSFTRHQGLVEDLARTCFPLELHKISEVVETPFGYHILQLTRRDPGARSFEESKLEIKRWLRREPYILAIHETAAKYPVVGVRQPMTPVRPPYLAETRPAGGAQTKPAFPLPMSRPSTRPAPLRPTLPPTLQRPTTRPAPIQPTTHPNQPRPTVHPAPLRPATLPAPLARPGGSARPPG